MSSILSRTCSLGTGESATSFVSRLAARNHIDSARDFCLDMGLTFQAIADGEQTALARIARLAGIPFEDLESGAIRKIGTAFELRGQRLWKGSLRRSRLYACPHCLAEDERAAGDGGELACYGRTEWLLEVMRACPIHQCALVEAASAPAKAPGQTHDFALLLREQLRDLPAKVSGSIPREPSSLEAYVRDRLAGRTGDSPWLDAMDLHAAITTCEMLGVLITVGPTAARETLTETEWHYAGGVGQAICHGGPEEIRQALTGIHRSAVQRRHGPDGPGTVYGYFYQWLAHTKRAAAFDPLRDLLRLHVMATMPLAAGEIVLGQPMQRRQLHSIWSASQETGRHPKRLRQVLAAAELIPQDHISKPDHQVIFNADDAAAFLRSDERGLSLKQVETYINAGRVQTKLLADHGLIQPFVEHQGGRGERRATYRRADLNAFLRRLSDGAEPVKVPDDGIHTIPEAAKRANCSAIEIVRLILDRKLRWTGRLIRETGYSAILVRLTEIKAHVHAPAYDGITAHEAVKRLMTSTRVVNELIRQGYLPRQTVINPINRCPVEIITTADFDRFLRTYATVEQIAVDRRITTARVRGLLTNVLPAITHQQVGRDFFLRAQISE